MLFNIFLKNKYCLYCVFSFQLGTIVCCVQQVAFEVPTIRMFDVKIITGKTS